MVEFGVLLYSKRRTRFWVKLVAPSFVFSKFCFGLFSFEVYLWKLSKVFSDQ
ncbi:hypothetical protein Hanom_Chr11g01056941 [Helianthus anomalus]